MFGFHVAGELQGTATVAGERDELGMQLVVVDPTFGHADIVSACGG